MNPVDYEAEYNNRARVPEHPAIIEGWARDAEAYRQQAGRRTTRLSYGPTGRQEIDVFAPEEPQDGATVMFIHGGYWQGLHRTFFSHLARGLNARGLTVALPSYDLCPDVRLGEIVDELRQACRALRDRGPLVVAGHSAGGHLAACLLATDWAAFGLQADLVLRAYAISGLFDLKPLIPTSVNKALGLSEPEAERLSPLLWVPPAGRVLDAVVGGDESAEYLRQSRSIADLWGVAGVATRYEAVPGANHFTVIAPLADPDSAMTRRLAELAQT
ncbi:MAG TPA: alpha/beta hydrolase [Microvirga sp.]|jgi:arylformamidase|nr:alpha/beta hydrolase [Microvirga sp.]